MVVSAASQQIRPSFSRFADVLSFLRPDGQRFSIKDYSFS
nr:MAG TPA: Type IV secretion-system coupling protein DNA-binding domain [Caudoviricetes sp.]